jgi:hypothetical protein
MKYNCHKNMFSPYMKLLFYFMLFDVLISWLKIVALKHDLWESPWPSASFWYLELEHQIYIDFLCPSIPVYLLFNWHGFATWNIESEVILSRPVVSVSAGICKKIPMSMTKRKCLQDKDKFCSKYHSHSNWDWSLCKEKGSGKDCWEILSFEFT